MSEDPNIDDGVEYVEEVHYGRSLVDMFDKMTLKEWWQRVKHGLKEPKDTGEYKWAKGQISRVSAPVAAVLLPLLILFLLVLMAFQPPEQRTSEVTIIDPEPIEELEEIEEIEEIVEDMPEPEEVEVTDEAAVADNNITAPDAPFSPQPTELDSVAIVKSPVIFQGMIGSRNPGSRGSLLGKHGGNGQTESAVMRALRWLKKNQNKDGSWPKTKPASTSLALLTFLAHGETPASEEFGYTVESAIRFLVNSLTDAGFAGRDGHDYTHPIGAYALSEAYAMTKVPMVKYAAEKAVARVVNGQNPSGGFNYNLKPVERDDTSYMGWCVQALKAGYLAKLDVPGLEEAKNKSIDGFRKNYGQGSEYAGGFGYTGPSSTHGLTGVGVLCMQLLGEAKSKEALGGLKTLEGTTFNWDPEGGGVHNKNYFWYYITQAKFHAGGDTWNNWNRLFSPVLVKNQTVIPKAKSGYVDHKGVPKDIGWWDMTTKLSGHTDGPVMNTCLAALQLQVYYRYLPTFMTPTEADLAKEDFAEDDGEIEIDVFN